MKRFSVDARNRITVIDDATAGDAVAEGGAFESEEQLSEVTSSWASARLIQMFNGLPKVQRVTRFTDRQVAIRRIWKAVQSLKPGKTNDAGAGAAPAEGTKKAKVIALLNHADGATMAELIAETGWQKHSIRGFLSGTVVRRMGLTVSSFKRDGERVYRIDG